MRIAKGPRPWSIWVFALVSVALATERLLRGLSDLNQQLKFYESMLSAIDWTHDWVIVAISAWFSIELIPVALVWFFASRFARWFVLVMAILPIAVWVFVVFQYPDLLSVVLSQLLEIAFVLVLAGLLFLPPSAR